MDSQGQPQTGGLRRCGSVLLLTVMVAALTMMAVATPASATSSGAAAWGENQFGQLGDGTNMGEGTTTNRLERVPVSGLSAVTAVAAKDSVSLALVNGTVMAWGDNHEGELGDGKSDIYPPYPGELNPGPENCYPPPVEPPFYISCSRIPRAVLSGVTAISEGKEFSLALMNDHTVTAWGMDWAGDLGNGGDGYSEQPERGLVAGLHTVKAISAGVFHSLALLEDGTVVAWGDNSAGQLGNPVGPSTCGPNPTPCSTTPVPVSGLEHVIAIAADREQSLALLENGTVMAWGGNGLGLLGNGTTNEAVTVPAPVCAPGATPPCSVANGNVLTGVTAIAAGEQFSMALMADGSVTAWGNNSDGELGTAPESSSYVPVQVNGLAGVTAISAANKYGLALSNGEVSAWGTGFLGNGDPLQLPQMVPVPVVGLRGVAGISAGTSHNLVFGALTAPTVTGVSPSTGSGAGGTSVTITGTGLSEATQVSFGSTPASSFTVSSGSITAVAPAGTGTVDVTVTSSGATSATSSADHYTYVAPPAVSTVTPNLGPTAGGTLVTITGAELTFATGVRFGGTPAVSFIVNSATSMSAVAPAGTGTVDVTVTTPGGTSTTGSGDHYRYVPPPTVKKLTPTKGSAAGATTVTIAGTELSGATAVKFGSASATRFTVASATSITAIAPPGTTGSMVDVTVTTTGGKSAITSADHYSYVAPAPPTVTKLSPTKGLAGGGTLVTISGTEFGGATAVSFGSASAVSFTVNSALSLTASSSAGTAKTVDVTVTTPSGISAISSNDHFQLGPPTITSISPHAGSAVGGSTVTISGTGFGLGPEATAFSFGSTVATSVSCTARTTCTVVVPSHVAGTVDVKATVSGMISPSGSGDQYTYN